MGRESRCAECAATIVVTSAKTQFRKGAMVLLCRACAGSDPVSIPTGDAAEVDYDLYVSIEEDADDIYDDVQVSVGSVPELAGGPPADGNIIYGADDDAVSGAVDVDSGAIHRPRAKTLPPVVVE